MVAFNFKTKIIMLKKEDPKTKSTQTKEEQKQGEKNKQSVKQTENQLNHLQSENEALRLKNQDLENKLKRAIADYQNLETRIARQRQELADYFKKDIVVKFLPVLDNLERASKTINDQGLKFVVKQFHNLLEEVGLKIVGQVGQEFDPHQHECIEVVNGDENKVIEVLEKGYSLSEKIVRPAKVKVGRKN